MKRQLIAVIENAVTGLLGEADSEATAELPAVNLEVPRNPAHGDFSSNIAMLLAKPLAKKPREIASDILARLENHDFIASMEVAGPGFLNFTLTKAATSQIIDVIASAGERFGYSESLSGERVLVEFVSANPTGPLHVGHGRGAAYGDAIASLLDAVGAEVSREYYVNDAGRQMDILALSVWVRYLQHYGVDIGLPPNGYKGDYIYDIADALSAEFGHKFKTAALPVIELEPDEQVMEKKLDEAIEQSRDLLGAANYAQLTAFVCAAVLTGIKQDLLAFNISFDDWFSELTLMKSGALDSAVAALQNDNRIYESDGAKWFRSTDFGDEKDRVVIRDNGIATYFASDIAYHREKSSRGYTQLINIWGADHHGYIARVRAAMNALGIDEKQLEIILVQFAALYRAGEKVAMSTRSGEFVTLKELIDEVGSDAARFFYLSRRSDQHLDFDLDLAKSKSNENPVYYVQYAHARICSVFEQLQEKGFEDDLVDGATAAKHLDSEQEKIILGVLARFPEVVEQSARAREPHNVTNYLRELAGEFHAYYNSTKFLVESADLRKSRLSLISAIRQVLNNGLSLLRISAPTKM